MNNTDLKHLIQKQKSNFSLDQEFYINPETSLRPIREKTFLNLIYYLFVTILIKIFLSF